MNVGGVIDTYCKANGLKIIHGELGENDPAPILPFLIMDCAYQEFCKEVRPVEMRHKSKQVKNAWLRDYKAFNHRLFSCLNEEQRDCAIEMMDEYGAYIGNDAFRVKLAVMDLVKGCSLEDQKLIGALLLCNIFSQVAQITWGCIFRNVRGHEEVCPELARMRTYSHSLCNRIVFLPEDINPNNDENLKRAVNAYMSRTTAWLKAYDHE